MLALDLLGPVQLRRERVPLALNVRKSQALLVLLARHGEMPRSRIVALLWPDLEEATGRRNLRRELARLREAGAGPVVCAQGDCLALAADVAVDAMAFESALQAGRADEALTLWRSTPADGLELQDAPGFEDWLAAERERLLRARQRALEASAAAHEARGDAPAALERVLTLIAEDPLQEQRHRDAMRLQAACGRREAALAQFEACRELLRAELDLAPMAETQALADALRATAARVTVAPRPPARPAPAGARPTLPAQLPLVGRRHELQQLGNAWSEGRPLLLEGEAGIGKSRLVQDFAAARGAYALVRSRPADAEMPYATFIRALRLLIGPSRQGPSALDALAPWVREELVRLLPERGPKPPPMRAPAERTRFIEACVQAWLALAADNFDAVIFDDWHHADGASRSLMVFITQRRREQGLRGAREILVHRPLSEPAARAATQRLSEAGGALCMALAPLDEAAVLELVERLPVRPAPQRLAARLLKATAGNPYFLVETLRHLVEQGLLEQAGDGAWQVALGRPELDEREWPVPPSVQQAVLGWFERLPASARRVLEAAALADEPFAPALLAPACALSELDTVLSIERAVEAQWLCEREGRGYAFVHDLARQALEASLGAERRRLVHRRLALGAEAHGAPAALIAAHHEASGDKRRAVVHRLAAGDETARVHAWDEALDHWRRGLADEPDPPQALALHLRSMKAAGMSGRIEQGLAHAETLRALASAPAPGLAAAVRVDALVEVAAYLARHDQAVSALELLDALPPSLSGSAQARALAARATACRRLGRMDEGRASALAALDMPAMEPEDRMALLETLCLAESAATRGRAAIGFADALVAQAAQARDAYAALRGRFLRGNALLQVGDIDRGEQELRAAAEACRQSGFVGTHRGIVISLTSAYQHRSRYRAMVDVLREGWDLQPPLSAGAMRVKFRISFIEAYVAVGDLGAAWEQLCLAQDEALALDEPAMLGFWLTNCTELCTLLGDQARARAVSSALDEARLQPMPHLVNEIRLAQARAALLDGEPDRAAQALSGTAPGAALDDPRQRKMLGLAHAALALARGDARQALEDGPAEQDGELRLHGLALRVQAEAFAGLVQAATAAAALEALRSPSAHALAAVLLHRALAAAARRGLPEAPLLAPAQLAGAEWTQRLAASLDQHPAQRAALLRFAG